MMSTDEPVEFPQLGVKRKFHESLSSVPPKKPRTLESISSSSISSSRPSLSIPPINNSISSLKPFTQSKEIVKSMESVATKPALKKPPEKVEEDEYDEDGFKIITLPVSGN